MSQQEVRRGRRGWIALLALFVGVAAAHASPRPDWPEVGRFDKHGRYQPPKRRELYRRRNGDPTVPRYPVILVHGQGGFKRKRIAGIIYGDYFNGAAKLMRKEGVTVHATETDPFAATEERARQLKEQLLELGYDKVNLVCHSMGGLDARYMVTHLGMADRVASITTVGTPHRGSWYADWVLEWVFEKQRFWKVWDWLGLSRESIPHLTVKYMNETFNPNTPDMPQVRYFSVGGAQGFGKTLLMWKMSQVIINILERRAVGKRLSLFQRATELAIMPKALRKELKRGPAAARAILDVDTSWIIPEEAGRNDSKVSVSSAHWGEYLGTVDADHWDLVGWFLGAFRAARFYRNVAHMLSDAGY